MKVRLRISASSNQNRVKKTLFTNNHDPLKVFAKANHLGEGITRGIIKKLIVNSLQVGWSTGDRSVYLRSTN